MSGSKSARAAIQVFEKASKFGSFLKETVDDIPSPATTGNAPSFAISPYCHSYDVSFLPREVGEYFIIALKGQAN